MTCMTRTCARRGAVRDGAGVAAAVYVGRFVQGGAFAATGDLWSRAERDVLRAGNVTRSPASQQ